MMLSNLQDKDVVNLFDGKKIGMIIDVNIDRNGRILELYIQRKRFLFFPSSSVTIRWDQIDKIGKDVILVNVTS